MGSCQWKHQTTNQIYSDGVYFISQLPNNEFDRTHIIFFWYWYYTQSNSYSTPQPLSAFVSVVVKLFYYYYFFFWFSNSSIEWLICQGAMWRRFLWKFLFFFFNIIYLWKVNGSEHLFFCMERIFRLLWLWVAVTAQFDLFIDQSSYMNEKFMLWHLRYTFLWMICFMLSVRFQRVMSCFPLND